MEIRELPDGRMVLDSGPTLLRFVAGAAIATALAAGCYKEFLPHMNQTNAVGVAISVGLLVVLASAFGRKVTLDTSTGSIEVAKVLLGGMAFPGETYRIEDIHKVDFEHEVEYTRHRRRTFYRSFFVFRDRSELDIEKGSLFGRSRQQMADDAQRVARYCGVRFGG